VGVHALHGELEGMEALLTEIGVGIQESSDPKDLGSGRVDGDGDGDGEGEASQRRSFGLRKEEGAAAMAEEGGGRKQKPSEKSR
jgi:hypothetical protein